MFFSLFEDYFCFSTVPSPPRNLIVELYHEDPPQAQLTWQRPSEIHGNLENYKVIYGVKGEKYVSHVLPASKQFFISEVLGKFSLRL